MENESVCCRRWFIAVCLAGNSVAFATEAVIEPFYAEVGGQQGIAALVETFATHLYTDPRTATFFKGVDPNGTRERLQAQFCDLSGGPCKTINPDMKKTHSGMDITKSDFDAVVSILTQSMQERGISVSAQQRLLRKVMPMRYDIVNKPE